MSTLEERMDCIEKKVISLQNVQERMKNVEGDIQASRERIEWVEADIQRYKKSIDEIVEQRITKPLAHNFEQLRSDLDKAMADVKAHGEVLVAVLEEDDGHEQESDENPDEAGSSSGSL